MNKYSWCWLILIGFFSCKKDKPEELSSNLVIEGAGSVLIGNEGNFQFGNSSLTHYSVDEKTTSENVFKTKNDENLGDVLQSMYAYKNRIYLVLNNSGKIQVIHKQDFTKVLTISGFTSPRYFLPVSNAKAYVTDLYSNSIQVVDLNTGAILKNISVNGWTEQLYMIYGKVFVCNKSNNQLYVVDAATDLLIDSVQVGSAPSSIVEDKNGMLWVLNEGDINNSSSISSLIQLNPVSYQISKMFNFPVGKKASQLAITGSGDTLYFLSEGVQRMLINDESLPSSAFLSSSSHTFYGLGVNPLNGDVYVSDAFDYIQKSKVYRYNKFTELMDEFYTGINSSSFLFK